MGVLVCAMLLGGAAPATAAAKRPPCPTKGVRIVAGGAAGNLYYRATRELDRVRLCSYRTRRRATVGWDDCTLSPGVAGAGFNGRWLAVAVEECTPGGTSASIDLWAVRRARRARTLVAAPDVRPRPPGAALTLVTLPDLVVAPDGAVAWIARISDPDGAAPGTVTYELRRSLSGTTSELVAAGPDLEPGSLALAGGRLYWTQLGQPRSAPLRP